MLIFALILKKWSFRIIEKMLIFALILKKCSFLRLFFFSSFSRNFSASLFDRSLGGGGGAVEGERSELAVTCLQSQGQMTLVAVTTTTGFFIGLSPDQPGERAQVELGPDPHRAAVEDDGALEVDRQTN
jgi:hypothetical protein